MATIESVRRSTPGGGGCAEKSPVNSKPPLALSGISGLAFATSGRAMPTFAANGRPSRRISTRAHARRIQRPAGNRDARTDDGFAGGRIDVAHGTRDSGRRRRGRHRRGALAIVRDERVHLEAGDAGDHHQENEEGAQRRARHCCTTTGQHVRGSLHGAGATILRGDARLDGWKIGRDRHGAHCSPREFGGDMRYDYAWTQRRRIRPIRPSLPSRWPTIGLGPANTTNGGSAPAATTTAPS